MSNNLNTDQVAEGQADAEVTVNDMVGQVDAAITEKLVVLVDNTNAATISATDFRRNNLFSIDPDTPAPTGAITITVSAIKRGLFVVLNTTAQDVDVEITAQPETPPTIPAGEVLTLHCDGVNVRSVGGGGTSTIAGTVANLVRISASNTAEDSGIADTDVMLISDSRYDLQTFFAGSPTSSQLIVRFLAVRALTLPTSLTGSACYAGVAATASTTFDIQKNGVSVGSLNFAAAAQTATFTFASPVTLAATDRLDIIAPGSADATLADITFALKARANS